jgi:recombination protein RecT
MASNELAKTPASAPASASKRFTEKVLREFAVTAPQGVMDLNDHQRRIIQGYFIVIDRNLKAAEEERLRKNASNSEERYNNNVPCDWQHVNMTDLALDAVHYARMGLDMQEKNHLFPIPYLNKKGGFYDITFMVGYSGKQYITEMYAIVLPKSVTIEVVYSTDVFKPLKKSKSNPVESYEFDITNAFDRGDIIGGFGYIEYDEPSKNTLIIMSLNDIMKRKPPYASARFWGGKSSEWKNGKKVEVELDGWLDEMCRKTLVREVFSGKYIPLDPGKIDDNYQYLREREVVYAEAEVAQDALENANRTPIFLPPQSPPQVAERTLDSPTQDDMPTDGKVNGEDLF